MNFVDPVGLEAVDVQAAARHAIQPFPADFDPERFGELEPVFQDPDFGPLERISSGFTNMVSGCDFQP